MVYLTGSGQAMGHREGVSESRRLHISACQVQSAASVMTAETVFLNIIAAIDWLVVNSHSIHVGSQLEQVTRVSGNCGVELSNFIIHLPLLTLPHTHTR